MTNSPRLLLAGLLPPARLMTMVQDLEFRVCFPVDDEHLSRLHALAFKEMGGAVKPWTARLERHSLNSVGAFLANELIGFVHACWDGGDHAFLLDAIVDPRHQRRGVGRLLVQALFVEAQKAGCEWLHVDYEPHLDTFYRTACGFKHTKAGLIRLTDGSVHT